MLFEALTTRTLMKCPSYYLFELAKLALNGILIGFNLETTQKNLTKGYNDSESESKRSL